MYVFKFDRWTFSVPLALAHRLRVALQPKQESLKKVLDGNVALMDGGQESSLPGGEPEAKFCCSLSRLLNLDEVNRHVMLEAALVCALFSSSYFCATAARAATNGELFHRVQKQRGSRQG